MHSIEEEENSVDVESGKPNNHNGCLETEIGAEEKTSEMEPCLPTKNEGLAPASLPNEITPKKKLTLTKQNGKVKWTGIELEDRMKKKFGVNREGFYVILGGFLFLLLLVIILVVVVSLWPASCFTGGVCNAAACYRASSVVSSFFKIIIISSLISSEVRTWVLCYTFLFFILYLRTR